MSGPTTSSTHDARDAEDRRLLEAGDHKLLLAGYFHPIRERCFLRLRDRDAADEAAQQVFARLLAELAKGKSYPVPFRVVAWMVTEWTLRGFYKPAKSEAELPDNWDPEAPDAFAEWEQDYDRSSRWRTRSGEVDSRSKSKLGSIWSWLSGKKKST